MTAKRDLKKRVRARQAQTGESYMTARRHVVGEGPPAAPATPIPVDELIDLTEAAIELDLRCTVLAFPRLAAQVDPVLVLTRVRDALTTAGSDRDTELLRALVLRGDVSIARPVGTRADHERFLALVRVGVGGTSRDGRMLAIHIDGLPVVCAAWRSEAQLVLMTVDDSVGPTLSRLGARRESSAPMPFLVFEGKRHALTRAPFVIGRHPTCDLVIRDGIVSRRHAAVLHRNGSYYIKDLGSHLKLEYKGLTIDNKRIQEGDVFQIGTYELRFTFRGIDA